MATTSLLQIWNPTTKQYESVEGENGSINVTATIAGGDAATETTLAAVENAVDGLEGSIVTADTGFVSNGAAVSATVKSGAGTIYSVYAHNNSASTLLYLWLSNSLSAGGTLMVAPIKLVAGAQLFIDTTYFTADGSDFSVGFTWGFSTSPSAYSAHSTAADCIISGRYE